MKSYFQFLFRLAALVLFTGLFACKDPQAKQETDYKECTAYSCPMHPDKTSTKPAECPVCRMEMLPLDSALHDHAEEQRTGGS